MLIKSMGGPRHPDVEPGGVWRQTDADLIFQHSPTDSPEFDLARDFFQVNLDDLHSPRNYAPALRWVLAAGDERFGFTWTCEVLGLDPDATRDRLLETHLDPEKLMAKPRLLASEELCPALTCRVRNYIKNQRSQAHRRVIFSVVK